MDEARRILVVAAQRHNSVRFALALGFRQGEALGLQWRDVDVERNTIIVRRAIQRHTWQHGCGGSCGRKRGADCPARSGGGLAVVATKSRAGRRLVGVPAPLTAALREHRASQENERTVAADVWQDGGWVFSQPNGKPIDPRADYQEWRTLLQLAGVRPARLHDARHTAATVLLVLGVPLRAVMEVMGWSQASMASRYQHVPREILDGIAEQVGELLWQPDDPGEDDDAGEAGALAPT